MKGPRSIIFTALFTVAFTVILALSAPSASAYIPDDQYGYVYLGVGSFYAPTTGRIGIGDWEYGVLERGHLGANRIFRNRSNILIATLGVMLDGLRYPGVSASVGAETFIWRYFSMRGEMYSSVAWSNQSEAGVIFGGVFHY